MASNLLVTGKWGEVHVTSAQQRNFNSGVVGDGQYVMSGLTATMSDSNTLHVAPGVACMNGADVEVPAGGADVTVTNGTQGMLRNDLICVRYTMDGPTQKEKAELVCVRGTPAATDPQDPEYNDGSVLDGSLVVDMPLYRVPLDGISVGDPEPLFDVLTPMAEMWESVSQDTGWVPLFQDQERNIDVRARRVGNVAYLNGKMHDYPVGTEWEAVTVVPSGMRPDLATYFAGSSIGGDSVVLMDVAEDGTVYAKTMGGAVEGLMYSASWPAA